MSGVTALAMSKVTAPPMSRMPAATLTTTCGGDTKDPGALDRAIFFASSTECCSPGRKRGREAASIETAASGTAPAESAEAEVEVPEPPRKRLLLVLLEGEDEEEVPPVTDEVAVEEVATAEVPDAEAAIAEATADEAAIIEPLAGESAVAEGTASESAESPLVVTAMSSPAATTPVEPSLVTPHHPSCIVFRSPPRPSLPLSTAVVASSPPITSVSMVVTQEPSAEGELVVAESSSMGTSILTPIASVSVPMPQMPLSQESTVVTELAVAEASMVPPATEVGSSSSAFDSFFLSLPLQVISLNCTPSFVRRGAARPRPLWMRILGPLLNNSESSYSWKSTK
ncbi:hypothetical protein Pyn_27432 [Prunus yedoensis var. nudiflora]|uniref:Uncharacterized protein n=1 Tax=Prunus yedoensis var. nudiflora TaxID=2094558 RepID=A0A314XF18_PRUYE|nr:hypothetical protein Pyn_27432 [Prunus yedoensis var. nudiflora]